MEHMATEPGVYLDDTDMYTALLTSFNYTAPAPNISLVVIPTEGDFSLSSITYFNSSFCAILDTWHDLQSSPNAVNITSGPTSRNTIDVLTRNTSATAASPNYTAGQLSPDQHMLAPYAAADLSTSLLAADTLVANASRPTPQVRMQFLVEDLLPQKNYTAFLVASRNDSGVLSRTLYPSVKFVTKNNPSCRLLKDVPFCPELAYSIPANPDMSTDNAIRVLGEMIEANFGNFSATLSTFPCDSDAFGQYSSVATCADCLRAYQSWLCAVAIPRCTDLVDPALSAASQNGSNLEGLAMPANTQLYPYIVNRVGANSSRQAYIDALFDPGDYGELLPCITTCEMVTRSCPPVVQWACPKWTVTAQRDYGTFADAGSDGLGAGLNGGAGKDGMRFGGAPSRYVAYDSFGHVFCNPMSVDRLMRQASAAHTLQPGYALRVAAAVLVPVALWL